MTNCVLGEASNTSRMYLTQAFSPNYLQDSESQSKVVGPEPQYLDEFTSLLVPDDTRVMVDLLKLAVSCRSGEKGKEVLSAVLSGMGTAYPQVIFCILFRARVCRPLMDRKSAINVQYVWFSLVCRLLTCCWSCVSLSWRMLPRIHRVAVCPPSQLL